MDGFDKQHVKSITACEKKIQALIDECVRKITAAASMAGIDVSKPFNINDYPRLKIEADKLIKQLHKDIKVTIEKAEGNEWERSNNKNDELVASVIKAPQVAKKAGYMQRNDEDLAAFMQRKVNGMNLSDRVWNITDQFRTQIETAIEIAIKDHRTADELSRDVRQYLRYPDKLFRRVRDEKGVLHLSKAAKAFHPGRGVYRSSYMNARRLAATEINMAYRTSDDTRRQQLDFVVGIEVHLSNNHNCKGIPEGEFSDICDKLQGKYPKTFKFVGWHPHCRCYATSILKTREEVMEDIERRKKGLKPVKSVNEVKDVPDGFKEWVDQNQERIANANSLPYFLSDNGQMVDGQWVMNEMTPEPSLLDNAQQRHSMRTPEQIKDIKDRWKKRNEVIKGYETTKKRAGNILNMEKEWNEVSFEQLRKAMDAVSDKSVYRASDYTELKKMLQDTIQKIKQQQTAEKALSDVIPDVHKWHKQFTLDDLQKVKDGILAFKIGKATKYYVSSFEDLPLVKQKQLLTDEAKYVSDATYFKPHTLHKTWEVAKSAYEKQVVAVDNAIAWEPINAKLASIKTYSAANPKSQKIANLIAEAEKLKSAGGSVSQVEAKILEAEKIKAKNESSMLSHAKIAAQKKLKELADLQQKKTDLEQQKKDLEDMIILAKPTNAPGLIKMKENLKAVEKELKTIDKKIDKLGGNTFGQDAYSEMRKKTAVWDKLNGSAAAKALRGDASKCWISATEHEKDMMYDYTRHYCDVNEPLTLRKYSNSQTRAQFEDKVNAMTSYIDRASLEVDMWFQRGVGSINVIESMLKFAGDNSLTATYIARNPQSIVGKVIQQGSFMSAGSQKGKGFGGSVILNIYAPKGTKVVYVEPFSAYGRGAGRSWDGLQEFHSFSREHESIFQRGTKMRVTKVEYRNGTYYIDVDVIGHEVRDLKYVPDNYIGY